MTTKTKISQTWLASQTGPIECSIRARGRAPRSGPPAVRSQNPAPKSAPPNTAYAVSAEQQDDRDEVAHRTASSSSSVSALGPPVGPYGPSTWVNPPARRNRRLMPRSTRIAVTPRAT